MVDAHLTAHIWVDPDFAEEAFEASSEGRYEIQLPRSWRHRLLSLPWRPHRQWLVYAFSGWLLPSRETLQRGTAESREARVMLYSTGPVVETTRYKPPAFWRFLRTRVTSFLFGKNP